MERARTATQAEGLVERVLVADTKPPVAKGNEDYKSVPLKPAYTVKAKLTHLDKAKPLPINEPSQEGGMREALQEIAEMRSYTNQTTNETYEAYSRARHLARAALAHDDGKGK